MDVGCNGQVLDGEVLKNSSLQKALKENSIHIPQPWQLPEQTEPTPFVIVADDAFPLSSKIMKPKYGHNNVQGKTYIQL